MLRLWYRSRPLANLAVYHGARNDLVRGLSLRRLYATTTAAKGKSSAEKKAARVQLGLSRKAAREAKAAKAAEKAKKKAAPVATKEPTTKADQIGSVEKRPAPKPGGPGVWTSLQARLQAPRKAQDAGDYARIMFGEGQAAFFTQDVVVPSDLIAGMDPGQEAQKAQEADEVEIAKQEAKREAKRVRQRLKRKEEREARDAKDKAAKAEKAERKAAVRAKKKVSKKGAPLDVKTIVPHQLELRPVEEHLPLNVPRLSYNLDRVLFNPGVYQIQDPRSRVFNFDPYLSSIMPVDEFDFDALKEYITSSKDVKLRQLSAAHGMKYCGSTSSMTSILAHFHFLLSAWRPPNLKSISRTLTPESYNFTTLTRGPSAAFAHFKDGVYAIDADKQYDSENVLSMLGKSMEKLLTLPKEEYEKYRRTRSHQLSEEEKNAEESYHYTTMGDFMMRSQLDAHDPRLPGSGMFDLKTRAVVSIRMDVRGYEKGVGYEIRERFGQWESFEREFYDMIRAAFLKYSLQVRMGRMDGIFVAFHNTQRIFGFQYISLSEMDLALHGTSDTRLGDQEFKASLTLLNELLNRATKRFPGRTLRLHVETRPTKVPLTYFFVEPVSDEQMQKAQDAGQKSVDQIEHDIQKMSDEENAAEPSQPDENRSPEEAEESSEENGDGAKKTDKMDNVVAGDIRNNEAWESMMAKVEETVENESLGIGSVREAVQDALEHSGLLADKTELETEQCLDAMVASLGAHSAKIRSLREKPTDEDESLELSRESEEETSRAEETTSHDNVEAESPTEEPQPQGTSLKDLILKATEGIQKTQNLTTFQRMFADMATKSTQPPPSQNDQDNDEDDEEDDDDEDEDEDKVNVKEDEDVGVNEEEDLREDEELLDNPENEEAGEEEGDEVSDHGLEDDAADEGETGVGKSPKKAESELMGLYVTIRNKMDGKYVERPDGDDKDLDWSIEYNVVELPTARARTIYGSLKRRRRTVLSQDSRSASWHHMFKGHLPLMTKRGKEYREERTQKEANSPVFVAWDQQPLADVSEEQGEDKTQ